MNELQIFNFESNEIRAIEIDGNPWFVAKDIATALGFKNTNKAVNDHCKKSEIIQLSDIQGGNDSLPPHMKDSTIKIIPESDMYRLIMRSNLPSAERFQDLVTEVIIPTIRKTGFYSSRPKKLLRAEFYERLSLNINNIPWNKVSIINETLVKVYSYAKNLGYDMAKFDKKTGTELMIDISIGKTFASEMKKNRPDLYKQVEKYTHIFPDGRTVQANLYPIEVLPLLYKHIQFVWLPKYSIKYFTKRDPKALPYINEMIKLLK